MSDELVRALREHGTALYRISCRILGDTPEVDDVLQDAVLEGLEVSRREEISSWVGLLKRLVVFRSLDRLRKRRPELALDQLEVASAEDSPAASAIAAELQVRLRRSLGHIPPREAQVFCLRYFESLSNQQIALTLGVSPAAVATALRKARAKLSDLMADELSERNLS